MPLTTTNTIAELTEGTLNGNGIFDLLAKAVKAQLNEEFDAERIRGTDYANAVAQSLGNVLAQAVQYSTSKLRLDAELDLLAAQAEQVRQEIKTSAQQEKLLAAQTSHVAKQELQTVQQTINLVSQNDQIRAQTAISEYQLTSMLPVELANLTKTGLNITAQTGLTTQQTDNLLVQKTHEEAEHLLKMQSIEVQIGKTTADTVLVTKQCLLTEAQAVTQGAQSSQVNAETRQIDYVTSFQIPAQVAATEAQADLSKVQEALVAKQTLQAAAQVDQIDAQTLDIKQNTAIKMIEEQIQAYTQEFKLPKEVELMTKEIALKENQLSLGNKELLVKQAQVDIANKDIQLKENQLSLGIKELALRESQVAISAKDLLIKGEQLNITKYELANKLPADVALTKAQSDLYTQKVTTEKAQVDPSVVLPESTIAINNKLITEQSKTFLRSAQQTAAKVLIDTWVVRNQADPDGNRADATNKLQDANIGKAVDVMLNGIDVTLV